ncbi:MAG: peptide chain release factor N(5)-glutamine methyltransferase [Spirochaetaceae bacterium]|jgi:release factor glutamine methyltransferase|nr:peptide chain release factor N(5)-glutamine methyltransferase [Spirochaetaceae bacterium]
MPSIQELLSGGRALLAKGGISSPALDTSLLLADVLGLSREKLYAAGPVPLDTAQRRRFETYLRRRQAGEPVAYILGHREFWGLDFTVGPAVLVPRPDTETLVEKVLAAVNFRFSTHSSPGQTPTMLDLCTGSGAVAIAIKHSCPELEVWAADISEDALKIARYNAAKLLPGPPRGGSFPLGPQKPADPRKIRFIRGDLFAALGHRTRRFSLISANAPYVPSETISRLAPELRHEPRLALDGGRDGMDIIRRITAEAPRYLETRGTLFMEAGPSHMKALKALMEAEGFTRIAVHRDLGGLERVIEGSRP